MSIETHCGQKVVLCGEMERQIRTEWDLLVEHAKHVKHELTLWNGYAIPLWKRDRDFGISMSETRERDNIRLIRYWDDNNDVIDYYQCDDGDNNANSASVSESAVFLDSRIFILDPDNKNAFWCEYRDEMTFSAGSSDMAAFKMMFGTGWFHKLKITSVTVQRSQSWHLMLNNVDSVVHTVSDSLNLYNAQAPLILCWPIVPSMAIPLDEEIIEFGFYDYNEGGPDEALARAEREGGKDFYYPEWLQAMGQDRTRDIADAQDRFHVYFLHEYPAPLRQNFYCPGLPYGEVRGNVAKDAAGNILASVRAGDDVFVNKLIGAGGGELSLPEIMEGEKLRLFAVGLI